MVSGKNSFCQLGEIIKTTTDLAVNNMFDKKYYSYALVNSSTNPTTFNAYPDLSRKVMATFEYKFR